MSPAAGGATEVEDREEEEMEIVVITLIVLVVGYKIYRQGKRRGSIDGYHAGQRRGRRRR